MDGVDAKRDHVKQLLHVKGDALDCLALFLALCSLVRPFRGLDDACCRLLRVHCSPVRIALQRLLDCVSKQAFCSFRSLRSVRSVRARACRGQRRLSGRTRLWWRC